MNVETTAVKETEEKLLSNVQQAKLFFKTVFSGVIFGFLTFISTLD